MGAYFQFVDGPAAEASMLYFHRVPLYLRVVREVDGRWDALDQLEDECNLGDTIFIYKLRPGRAGHIKGRTHATSGFIVAYEHTDDIDPAGMDDRERWRAAVESAVEREKEAATSE